MKIKNVQAFVSAFFILSIFFQPALGEETKMEKIETKKKIKPLTPSKGEVATCRIKHAE